MSSACSSGWDEVRGTTTVMVTHDSRILERADRILTLEDGRLVADTAPA